MSYVLGMDASKLSVLLSLYTFLAVSGLFRLLQRNLGMRVKDGISHYACCCG